MKRILLIIMIAALLATLAACANKAVLGEWETSDEMMQYYEDEFGLVLPGKQLINFKKDGTYVTADDGEKGAWQGTYEYKDGILTMYQEDGLEEEGYRYIVEGDKMLSEDGSRVVLQRRVAEEE